MAIIDTTVVNMHTNACDIAIDRSGPFGNPYRRGMDGDLATVLARYREYFYRRVEQDAGFKQQVLALRGKRLGCWCTGPCHGMIIVEYIENYFAAQAAPEANI